MSHDLEKQLEQMPLRRPSGKLDDAVLGMIRSGRVPASLIVGSVDANQAGRPIIARLGISHWLARAASFAAAMAVGALLWNWVQSMDGSDGGHRPGRIVPAAVTDVTPIEFPVKIRNTYTDLEPEGVVEFGDRGPARQVRLRKVDHVRFVNEDKNIKIEMTVPRQEVFLVPLEEH